MLAVFSYADQNSLDCGPIPEKPVVPHGPTAEKWQIELAIDKINKYNIEMKKCIECRKAQINFLIKAPTF